MKTNMMNSSLLLLLFICSVSCVKIHYGTPYVSNIAESSANSKDFLKDCKISDVYTNNLIANCGTERKIIDLEKCLLVDNDGRMRIMDSASITGDPLFFRRLNQCVNCKVESTGTYTCDCKTSDEKDKNTNSINLDSLIGWDTIKKEMFCQSTRENFKTNCNQEFSINGGAQLTAEITCSGQKYKADLSPCFTFKDKVISKRTDKNLLPLFGTSFPQCKNCLLKKDEWMCDCYFDHPKVYITKTLSLNDISNVIGFDTLNKKTFCM